MIQAVVTGEHIAGGCGDEKIIGIVKAEQFEGNEHGGNGTVGDAAEHGDRSLSYAIFARFSFSPRMRSTEKFSSPAIFSAETGGMPWM